MKTSDFDYSLPPELIAQTPLEPRDASRLLVLDRSREALVHTVFNQISEFLRPGDLLVLNETRVIPARLFARKTPGGGRVELLLLRKESQLEWEVLGGGKGLNPGCRLLVEQGPEAEVTATLNGPRRVVRFTEPIEAYLERAGHVPLPPYIHAPLQNGERYQTVYARESGSAAAPTAGLHFTPRLLDELEARGIRTARLVLHIGLDTFAPVTEEQPEGHRIHSEWCRLDEHAARLINQARREGNRVIAVGTTSVRTLESAARVTADGESVGAYEGATNLFILPGYQFKVVDAIVTNFHLPRSTLLMLVSAFAGRERILHAYQIAMQQNYRFYSFGDAMLIL